MRSSMAEPPNKTWTLIWNGEDWFYLRCPLVSFSQANSYQRLIFFSMRKLLKNLQPAYLTDFIYLVPVSDVDVEKPDEKSVMTYVAQFLKHLPERKQSGSEGQLQVEVTGCLSLDSLSLWPSSLFLHSECLSFVYVFVCLYVYYL